MSRLMLSEERAGHIFRGLAAAQHAHEPAASLDHLSESSFLDLLVGGWKRRSAPSQNSRVPPSRSDAIVADAATAEGEDHASAMHAPPSPLSSTTARESADQQRRVDGAMIRARIRQAEAEIRRVQLETQGLEQALHALDAASPSARYRRMETGGVGFVP